VMHNGVVNLLLMRISRSMCKCSDGELLLSSEPEETPRSGCSS
jgi:hypothetical protein